MDVEGLVAAMQGPDRAIRIVTANRMPAVVDLDLVPNPESGVGVPPDVIALRAHQISADGQFSERVGSALAQRYPPWPAAEVVEQRMYEGFPSRADMALRRTLVKPCRTSIPRSGHSKRKLDHLPKFSRTAVGTIQQSNHDRWQSSRLRLGSEIV